MQKNAELDEKKTDFRHLNDINKGQKVEIEELKKNPSVKQGAQNQKDDFPGDFDESLLNQKFSHSQSKTKNGQSYSNNDTFSGNKKSHDVNTVLEENSKQRERCSKYKKAQKILEALLRRYKKLESDSQNEREILTDIAKEAMTAKHEGLTQTTNKENQQDQANISRQFYKNSQDTSYKTLYSEHTHPKQAYNEHTYSKQGYNESINSKMAKINNSKYISSETNLQCQKNRINNFFDNKNHPTKDQDKKKPSDCTINSKNFKRKSIDGQHIGINSEAFSESEGSQLFNNPIKPTIDSQFELENFVASNYTCHRR